MIIIEHIVMIKKHYLCLKQNYTEEKCTERKEYNEINRNKALFHHLIRKN